jgi:hypothetical protein
MSVLSRFASGGGGERRVTALASAAARLFKSSCPSGRNASAPSPWGFTIHPSSTSTSMMEAGRSSATSVKRANDGT